MPETRLGSMTEEISSLAALIQTMREDMKAGQDKIEAALIQTMREDMKAGQDKIEASQDKMKDELKREMKASQEELKNEVKQWMLDGAKELYCKLNNDFESIKSRVDDIDEQVENVKEEVKSVKEEVKARIEERVESVKEEVNAKVHEIREEMDKLKKGEHFDSVALEQNILSKLSTKINTASMKFKPPTFDGTVSWSTYFRQFEAAASASGWNDDQKATSLITLLRGDALDILHTLSIEEQKNFKLLVNSLEMRFGDKHLEQVYEIQLKGRTQKFNETLQQFQNDIARLVKLAYSSASSEIIERLGVQSFIDGLRDSETQLALRMAKNDTLADALTHALQFETAKQASKSNCKVREAQIQENSNSNIEKMMETILEKFENLPNVNIQGKKTGRPLRLRCWNCGEEGHVRSSCRKDSYQNNFRNSEN